MGNEGSQAPKGWWPFVIASGYLAFRALWRLVVPAHEYQQTSIIWLDILLTAALLVAVIALYRQIRHELGFEDPRTKLAGLLVAVDVIAGLAIYGIRFGSYRGWWTGHLNYSLGS